MTIVSKSTLPRKIEIDLTGPQGNAYCLLGYASQYGRQLGKTDDQIEAIRKDMTSSDYDHLVAVFDREFGHVITLLTD